MGFLENPFAILGAGTKDNPQRLAALAEKDGEGLGSTHREALAFLLDPEKRLAAELSWFPGLSQEKTTQIMRQIAGEESGEVYHSYFNEIAAINYFLAVLPRAAQAQEGFVPEEIAAVIEEIDERFAELTADNARDIINGDRKIAGLPLVADLAEVDLALAFMERRIIHEIQSVFNALPMDVLVRVYEILSKKTGGHGTIIAALSLGAKEVLPMVEVPVSLPAYDAKKFAPGKKNRNGNIGWILAASLIGGTICAALFILYFIFSLILTFSPSAYEEGFASPEPYVNPGGEYEVGDVEDIPESGYYWNYSGEEMLAPFLVVAPEAEVYYYVLLVDAFTGEDVAAFFVWPGETEEIGVPFGDYLVYFAYGSEWYGEDELFGFDTYFEEIGGIFSFYDDGLYYMGNTLDLPVRPVILSV